MKHKLSLFFDAAVTRKPKKFNFFTETNDYMGAATRLRHLEIALHTKGDIKGLKASQNVTKLKSFHGFCNIFRQFLPNYARISSPIDDNLRNDQPFKFQLNKRTLQAMKSLQKKLISSPVLALPYVEGLMTLDADPCNAQSWMCITAGTTSENGEASRLLVPFANKSRSHVRYDAS